MKKLLFVCLAAAVCALFQPIISECAELPEIASWQNGELRVTMFDTISGYRGSWQERNYRTASGTLVNAVWIEGAGEKGWAPPDGEVSADDGPAGNGATYKTVAIVSEKGLLERYPVTGYSVAVKIAKMGTLTVESKYAEENEILNAAETLVREMTAKRDN